MITPKFPEMYAKLNTAQKRAVDTIEGPVMVVAGPGTGKTEILTLRIANILKKTDTEPESILALTFTESGVASMRRRLLEAIGAPAYSVTINTFHGFCNDIIKNYPEEFPRIIGSQNITEVDQIRILENVIGNLPLQEIKPFGDTFYYVREILSRVSDLKRENITPEKFSELIQKEQVRFEACEDLHHVKGPHAGKMKGEHVKAFKHIQKTREFARVYAQYEEELTRNRFYDWSDMIMEVARALETNENLLRMLQETHQYILVDEHQDTNNAQNRVMELLASFHPNPNIFMVGDEKQAIFRFQGASLENFLHFKKLYPQATLIVLEENYRSTQSILDSAHDVITKSALLTPQRLKAMAGHPEKTIMLYAFSRAAVESYFVAQDIKKKLDAGVAPHDIAVLYRDNRDAFPFVRMLEKIGVPFSIESDEDVTEDADVRKLLLILRAIADFGSDEKIAEALHVDFLGLYPLDVYKLIQNARAGKISILEIMKSEPLLVGARVDEKEKIQILFQKFSEWARMAKNRGFTDFFETIVRDSGFLAHLLSLSDAIDKINKLNGLFDEVKFLMEKHKEYRLHDFLMYLDTLSAHNLLIKKSAIGSFAKNIRLMTAHRSKGQQFEYVYIVNAQDGHWGNKSRRELLKLPLSVFALDAAGFGEGADNDDERRLFYVAMTRAKKEVIVTYARESDTKKEMLPSQFIEEIRPDLILRAETEAIEKEFGEQRELMYRAPAGAGGNLKEKEFIRELFERNGLSVSGLNNYLTCPWKYFYTNLIRIPKAKDKHQMYGTAVHAALRDFFENLKDRDLGKTFLLQKFHHYLNQEPISESDFKEALGKGEHALSGYYDFYYASWPRSTISEKGFNGIMLTPEIRLTGIIDKLEFLGAGAEVNVVDYKTGRPKTRGEIEGSTKDSEGNIKRQLVFYNILLDRYEEGRRFKMVSADVDFVEPDEKGRYHKERYEILSSEVSELEETIKKAGDEILNLAFWDKRCGGKDCEFCALREVMQ
ncbi:MAG: ATP-dependent DNA helicase [Patescibacteria group bacterium]